MSPDLIDRLGRQLAGPSREAGRSLWTIDQDTAHGEGANQRKPINFSHAQSSTHLDACMAHRVKRGLDVLNLLLNAGDELRLVSAVDREDLTAR